RFLDAGRGDGEVDRSEGDAVILGQGEDGVAGIERGLRTEFPGVVFIRIPGQGLAEGCFLVFALMLDDKSSEEAGDRIIGLVGFRTVVPAFAAGQQDGLRRNARRELVLQAAGRGPGRAVVLGRILLIEKRRAGIGLIGEADLSAMPGPRTAPRVQLKPRPVGNGPGEGEGRDRFLEAALVVLARDFERQAGPVEQRVAAADTIAEIACIDPESHFRIADRHGVGEHAAAAEAVRGGQFGPDFPGPGAAGALAQDHIHKARMTAHVVFRQGLADQLDMRDIVLGNALQHGFEAQRLVRRAAPVDQQIAETVSQSATLRIAVGERKARNAPDHVQRRHGRIVGEESRHIDGNARAALGHARTGCRIQRVLDGFAVSRLFQRKSCASKKHRCAPERRRCCTSSPVDQSPSHTPTNV
ncbi:MAG: hypothetical protein CMC70_06665, partial [Flavobacteriaceae bacterium]|nr:hypothetical protein [Flavobacteriaceae bacterium]